MKIPTFFAPVFLLIFDYILSIPALSSIVNIRVDSVSFLGVFRFVSLALVAFNLIQIMKGYGFIKIKRQFIIPLIILLLILAIQVFVVPTEAVASHLRGCTRIVFWFLSSLSIILGLSPSNEKKIRIFLIAFLTVIFALLLLQYPILIAQARVGVGDVLDAFSGGSKIKVFGLLEAANEDANCIVTLLPFALLFVESLKSSKKKYYRWVIILFTIIALLFNGTRTALVATFPLILFIYYSRLTIQRIIIFATLNTFLIFFLFIASSDLFLGMFSNELEDGGSLGYRYEHAWIPAINYTLEHSPLFGFGARGWEYLNEQIRLFDVINEWGNIQGSAAPHNVYVWTFVTWGTLGLVVYITLILILLAETFFMFKFKTLKNQSEREISKALFCSICAYCFWGFISNAHMPIGWMTFCILACLVASLKVKAASEKRDLLLSNPFLKVH